MSGTTPLLHLYVQRFYLNLQLVNDTHTYYTEYTQKNGAILKLTRNLFLTLHGHNVHRQQQQLPKFLMRYQQFASHAYCGAAGSVSKMASQ